MSDFEFREPVSVKQEKIPEPAVATPATPQETTKDKPKYDQTMLMKIFDEILFNGEVKEAFMIKGKLRIALRSRSTGEMGEVTKIMDEHIKNAGTIMSVAQKNSLLNLAFSLVEYNGRDLTAMDPLTTRLKFLEKIPAPIMDALLECLSNFDAKIMAACKEGEENF